MARRPPARLPHNAPDLPIFITIYLIGFVVLWLWAATSMRLGASVVAFIWTIIPLFWED